VSGLRPRAALVRLARDTRGASLTELALVTPLLFVFFAGIIDLGQGLSERFTMQQAVNRSLELLQAGPQEADAESDQVDYSYLTAEAAAAADVPPENVTLRRWLECDNVPQPDFAGDCDADEDTARYLQLRIEKEYEGWLFLDGYRMAATGAMRIQ